MQLETVGMTARNESTGHIQAGGAGIGEVSDGQIQQRARQLAVQEGRPIVTSNPFERARNELTQSVSPARSDDELANFSDEARAPEDAIGSSGRKVKNRGPEDESKFRRRLLRKESPKRLTNGRSKRKKDEYARNTS